MPNSELQFDEEKFTTQRSHTSIEYSKLSRLVISCSGGLIRSQKGVHIFFYCIVIISILWIFFAVRGDGPEANIEVPRGYNLVEPSGVPPRLDRPYE